MASTDHSAWTGVSSVSACGCGSNALADLTARPERISVVTRRLAAQVGVMAAGLLVPSPAGPPGTFVVAGYRLYPAPKQLAGQCRRAQRHVRFTILCPTVMPRSGDGVTAATAAALPADAVGIAPTTGVPWPGYPANVTAPWLYVAGIYGQAGTDPQNWSLNNPNYFFHFFVLEGKLSAEQLNLSGTMTHQQFLGRRTIGGHAGRLYSQVSYSLCRGDCGFTGHLTFVWRSHGATYAASLHRWSPDPTDPAVLAILSALIASLKPA